MGELIFGLIALHLIVSIVIYLIVLLIDVDMNIDILEGMGFCLLWEIFIPILILYCILRALIRVFIIFKEFIEKENE